MYTHRTAQCVVLNTAMAPLKYQSHYFGANKDSQTLFTSLTQLSLRLIELIPEQKQNINMPEDVVEEYNQNILRDLLPIYYKRLFPHKPFYKWLSYGLSK